MCFGIEQPVQTFKILCLISVFWGGGNFVFSELLHDLFASFDLFTKCKFRIGFLNSIFMGLKNELNSVEV